MGVKPIITEMDVRADRASGDAEVIDAKVADLYTSYLETVFANSRCDTVVTWGLTDRYTFQRRRHADDRPLALSTITCTPRKRRRRSPGYFAMKDDAQTVEGASAVVAGSSQRAALAKFLALFADPVRRYSILEQVLLSATNFVFMLLLARHFSARELRLLFRLLGRRSTCC